ncbi:basic amino acid/polyamine antiporter, APA family [Micromonospora phaseoli]|uniref:Basic amino acid/polyamine antiporter, APA family n=1 Tax=Micromonospora phaseoli TaxID=1144548 RepID=A0A1H7DT11_9ACTN|nr:APC family permease [Micromonospora phaseoli]PZW02354.1 amino acid/polyamine/organocation transporter (APC superfamily) [Micromonospora phaseoli]GIJ75644.1 amino acid transporter [Micromonospora phaseoli]SEK01435.1 basic amino acid/polyamine antiporter, APA family [Micromonospora phaseoli]
MDRLARRLGVPDAVVIGLGSMLGAGVFVVFAPATAAAGGSGLLAALVLAGFIAFCNATSSARLAARYPESGGTYVYGRERLGPFSGFLAGWGFVVGKTASCAAMALTIGAYLWPGQARLVAVLAVVAVTAVNLRGIGKTAAATRILVVLVLAVLALVAATGASQVQLARLAEPPDGGRGVLTAAGLLFFAFAGYARVATLGEEVRDPQRTIPRAVPLALGVVLTIYLALAVIAVGVLGADRLAASAAPLADVVTAAGLPGLEWVVRAGATVAVTGVLLSLLAGVGRTTLAMARHRDLPNALAAVHPRYRVPARAELAVAVAVILVVALGDVRGAIGFSSVTVLVYYAITNAAALTLGREPSRKLPVHALAVAGLIGCVLLAVNLPLSSVLAGFGVLALGAVWYAFRSARR